jgi:hypothetical protein
LAGGTVDGRSSSRHHSYFLPLRGMSPVHFHKMINSLDVNLVVVTDKLLLLLQLPDLVI